MNCNLLRCAIPSLAKAKRLQLTPHAAPHVQEDTAGPSFARLQAELKICDRPGVRMLLQALGWLLAGPLLLAVRLPCAFGLFKPLPCLTGRCRELWRADRGATASTCCLAAATAAAHVSPVPPAVGSEGLAAALLSPLCAGMPHRLWLPPDPGELREPAAGLHRCPSSAAATCCRSRISAADCPCRLHPTPLAAMALPQVPRWRPAANHCRNHPGAVWLLPGAVEHDIHTMHCAGTLPRLALPHGAGRPAAVTLPTLLILQAPAPAG